MSKQKVSPALGSLIRTQRLKNYLSQSDLADLVKCSTQMIGLIEKGHRKPSKELCEKLSEVLHIDREQAFYLRDEVITLSDEVRVDATPSLPEDLQRLTSILSAIEVEVRQPMIEDIVRDIEARLYQLLPSFTLHDIRQVIQDVRRCWASTIIQTTDEFLPLDVKRVGQLLINEQQFYFSLEVNEECFAFTLLQEERKHISLIENWLDEYTVSHLNEVQLPHIQQPRKVVTYLWFSPTISTTDRYRYLQTHDVNMTEVETRDSQLKWLLRHNTAN